MKALSLIAAALAACTLLPAHAGKADDTLVWAGEAELNSVDTYYLATRELGILSLSNCDSLLFRDIETGEYKGLLATDWKWVDDLTLELSLRQGVKFHDGRPFSSADVVATFQHLIKPEGRPAIAFPVTWIQGVEALGPDKVRFKLPKPAPMALEYLSGMTPIYPQGHYDKAPEVTGPDGKKRRDWGAVKPVCTGPYKLGAVVPGQSVTLERNPDYFKGGPKGTPAIKKIVYRTIADPQAQIAELLTGGIDWIWSLGRDDALKIGKMGPLTVTPAPTMRINALALDVAGRSGKNPLSDIRVRRALNHAVDKEAIAKNLLGGGAVVLHAACYPSQFGCTDEGVTRYAYDPAKARALLAEAGYPNGFTLPLYAYRDRPLMEAVAGYLRAVGVVTDLKFMQIATWQPMSSAGQMPIGQITWGSLGVNDASATEGRFFAFGTEDYARDAGLRDLVDAAAVSTDPAKRKALYKQALGRIADQAYWVPLFSQVRYYAFNAQLNFKPTPDEFPQFFAASWK